MSKPTFTPGCYASSVFYRIDAVECAACPHRIACAQEVRGAEAATVEIVSRFDKQFGRDKSAAVALWFAKRWIVRKVAQVDTSRFNALLSRWTVQELNPFHLTHNKNPADKVKEPVLHSVFQFMLDYRAFKPKDITEHILDGNGEMVKSKCQSFVTLICDTLVYSKILKKEKKGVLCL